MGEFLLPLFPLNVVLFPRTRLPLHIFEPRYKQMIADCLEYQWEFGIVLIQEQSLEDMGCTASISEVTRRYEDGRMDILVCGQRRFEILILDREKPYLRGAPQFFEDEGSPVPAHDSRRQQAIVLYGRVAEMLRSEGGTESKIPPDMSDEHLSYQIMSRLPAGLEFKQALLECRSESERLTYVIAYLEKMIVHLSVVIRAHRRAGGNGQGR